MTTPPPSTPTPAAPAAARASSPAPAAAAPPAPPPPGPTDPAAPSSAPGAAHTPPPPPPSAALSTPLRPDLALIAAHIPPGARVLDVGCGDGALMSALRAKGCDARGMELDPTGVAACVRQGLSVIQGDADTDLAFYPDASFDVAILSQTLQTTKRPDIVLDELLRIGRRAIVSFPNFGHIRVRLSLLFGGRMPVTRLLPVAWYATPNIHHLTIADFRALVAERHITVEAAWFLSGDHRIGAPGANWRAEHAVFQLARG